MKKFKYLVLFLAAVPFVTSCEDPMKPEIENIKSYEKVTKNPYWFEGLLDYAYVTIPTYDYKFDEVATDDAVSNVANNSYRKIAMGGWTASNDPEKQWDVCYKAIMNLNQFLKSVNDVVWTSGGSAEAQALNKAYAKRLSGEAYALRGIMKFYLLRNHGGVGALSGTLLGVPIYDTYLSETDMSYNFAGTPRATFAEGVDNALADLDKALTFLPEQYGDKATPDAKYSDLTTDQYNKVCGKETVQRIDGRIVKAYKVRLNLLAASPAFGTTSWETAATTAGDMLRDNGGLENIDPTGNVWFLASQVSADISTMSKENIWRRSYQNINTWEGNNYPPSQYGKGQVNPTQNFVDAFPMLNGYPISDPNSGYDAKNPYANRDPRLAQTVVYDKSKVRDAVIDILSGDTDDGTDKVATSTRTGYYLRKLLREDVNMTTGKTSTQYHLIYHVRFTEMYLAYAEAANEAWGPNGKGSYGFSAKDVIAAIRKRAGIQQPDAYLNSITSPEAMRTLIRNERRLELSFESFRFWDLRRWNANLNETAKGVKLDNGTYQSYPVEERAYGNHMVYGPIPETEITKFPIIEQNRGW